MFRFNCCLQLCSKNPGNPLCTCLFLLDQALGPRPWCSAHKYQKQQPRLTLNGCLNSLACPQLICLVFCVSRALLLIVFLPYFSHMCSITSVLDFTNGFQLLLRGLQCIKPSKSCLLPSAQSRDSTQSTIPGSISTLILIDTIYYLVQCYVEHNIYGYSTRQNLRLPCSMQSILICRIAIFHGQPGYWCINVGN